MVTGWNHVTRVIAGVALAILVGLASAQTPGQMEYERQQREYWRQQEQQRQEQQRQQQLMQENARRQQQEASRINAPTSAQGAASGAQAGAMKGGGGDATGAQAASAARSQWQARPPLAPDQNPLLGKWMRPTSTRGNPSDPFAAIQALAKGGLCEALFGGGGIFEFRANTLVGMDQRTKEQELDRVEYRGDAKHVVVLPKTTLKLIEFDFEGPHRIKWKGQDCVLVRVGSASSAAPATRPTQQNGRTANRQ